MTDQPSSLCLPGRNARRALSPETLSLVEEVLVQALRGLREPSPPPDAPDPGALEYDSWQLSYRA